MKAAVLEDIKKLVVRRVPDPQLTPREVVLRVQAVGVCGTDFHLFHGHSNYNLDANGRQIPLAEQPQILGHEYTGEVMEIGRDVHDLKPGDRVVCDQGLNCKSCGRQPLCEYCASGDCHQCVYYREHGITGLPGAMAEYIAMPAVNCLKISTDMPPEQAALVEPLACILHANDRAERTPARHTFDGERRIGNIIIFGAGPAGLLFLQYFRKVRSFDGLVVSVDVREKNLHLAQRFGATTINAARTRVTEAVRELTHGERMHLMVEACGNAGMFQEAPGFLRRQATVLIYGAGHQGQDISVLDPILFTEPTLVAPIGASGGFDPDGRPTTYRRAKEFVSNGTIEVLPFITHTYNALEDIHGAFEEDFRRTDYIKGVLKIQ